MEAPLLWTDTTTVNDAIEAWKQNGWQDLSPTTVRHYQELWDKHIKRSIGRREIAQLNPYEVERYLRRLKDEGTGRTTVKHIRAMLNRVTPRQAVCLGTWVDGVITVADRHIRDARGNGGVGGRQQFKRCDRRVLGTFGPRGHP